MNEGVHGINVNMREKTFVVESHKKTRGNTNKHTEREISTQLNECY